MSGGLPLQGFRRASVTRGVCLRFIDVFTVFLTSSWINKPQ